MLLRPNKKTMKKLREVLNDHYKLLDSSVYTGGAGVGDVDIPGLSATHYDYYPYVFYSINIDMIDNRL
jgi:V-type H+-transporting ATPase subunit C